MPGIKTVYIVYNLLSTQSRRCILSTMPAKGKKPLNLNIDPDILARIDTYRFKRMFATRTEAIEFLLDAALKMNPPRPPAKEQ
jgi:hypothetical protein